MNGINQEHPRRFWQTKTFRATAALMAVIVIFTAGYALHQWQSRAYAPLNEKEAISSLRTAGLEVARNKSFQKPAVEGIVISTSTNEAVMEENGLLVCFLAENDPLPLWRAYATDVPLTNDWQEYYLKNLYCAYHPNSTDEAQTQMRTERVRTALASLVN